MNRANIRIWRWISFILLYMITNFYIFLWGGRIPPKLGYFQNKDLCPKSVCLNFWRYFWELQQTIWNWDWMSGTFDEHLRNLVTPWKLYTEPYRLSPHLFVEHCPKWFKIGEHKKNGKNFPKKRFFMKKIQKNKKIIERIGWLKKIKFFSTSQIHDPVCEQPFAKFLEIYFDSIIFNIFI